MKVQCCVESINACQDVEQSVRKIAGYQEQPHSQRFSISKSFPATSQMFSFITTVQMRHKSRLLLGQDGEPRSRNLRHVSYPSCLPDSLHSLRMMEVVEAPKKTWSDIRWLDGLPLDFKLMKMPDVVPEHPLGAGQVLCEGKWIHISSLN